MTTSLRQIKRAGLACAIVTLLATGMAESGGAQEETAAYDTSLPIEIESDKLTVAQNNETATFTGNVIVIQGDLTMHAERLLVYYALNGQQSSSQPIRRIEVDGGVTMASPRENASSEKGVYDVVQGTLELLGNVTLTRDENVIRGDILSIDLATSVATMTANPSSGNHRVRALFVPAKDKN
ncbi:MAG: lipopolysaccharide transport periplasmic protein LptA [Geminicoccaceae bacterium]|nr:lipopolysaccharide transport periplasmic protein LptA [Geminicoccaceae bacterium]MCB9945823.1 lipopolysaccharide transport periplasmic protein LptA [Geminicoccaceae bacterium]